MFGSRHSTDPKPTLKNTLILESESRIYPLEVQLKYYKNL